MRKLKNKRTEFEKMATAKPDNMKVWAGRLALHKVTFGECSRFAVAPVHTRFDSVTWFVWDAEKAGSDGEPTIVRQAATFAAAVAGLV